MAAQARRKLELEWAREEQRAVELTVAERYARDPVGWINDHVWISSFLPAEGHDRQPLRRIKMRLFPAQEHTIGAWTDLDHLASTGEVVFSNLLIEKSRQIGETWTFAAVIAWLLHHHPVAGLCMHRKLSEIDDGGRSSTQKSLFGKIRYIDRNLDRSLLPYLQPLVFKQKPSIIENAAVGGVVHGEGQGDDPGRGQSLDFALVDEAAHVEHGELVHQSLASACPDGKAYLSTPIGNSNMHARIADLKPHGWKYLRLHWSEHPVYAQGLHVAGQDPDCRLCDGNRHGVRWEAGDPQAHRYPGKLTSPWYDREVVDKTDQQVAAELDIDREGSLPGRVFGEYDSGVHMVHAGIPFSPDLKVELAFDYGLDTTAVIVLQDALDEVRVIGLLEMGTQHGTSGVPEHVAAELRLYLQELGVPEKETRPEFTRFWRCVGDPAGHDRQQATGRSLAAQYRRQGFNIGRFPRRLNTVQGTTDCVRRLLLGWPKRLRICGTNAAQMGQHLASNRWKTNAVGEVTFGRAQDLNDDIHNHACRALAYWATATFPPPHEDGAVQRAPLDDVEEEENPVAKRRRLARERQGDSDRDGAVDPGFGLDMAL